jgi:hypothetical protein
MTSMTTKTQIEYAGIDRDKNIEDLASTKDINKLAGFLDQLPSVS